MFVVNLAVDKFKYLMPTIEYNPNLVDQGRKMINLDAI